MLQDIQLSRSPDRIVLANSAVRLEFAASDGRWLSLHLVGLDDDLIAPRNPAADFQIDGQWMIDKRGATLLRHELLIANDHASATLRLILKVQDEFEFHTDYTLYPGRSSFDRSASLHRLGGEKPLKLGGFLFRVPRACVAAPADCTIQAPGPFWPGRFLRIGTPYTSLNGTMHLHSAPRQGSASSPSTILVRTSHSQAGCVPAAKLLITHRS